MPDARRRTTSARRLAGAGVAAALVATLSGCGLFGDDEPDEVSVFELEPGTCFQTQSDAEAEIESLPPVDCSEEHTQEFIGDVPYTSEDGGDTFPGQDALDDYAQGACAQAFESYVGISYLDSKLFLTYLLPSPRSWDQDDRAISCFVTSAGTPLEGSVKDSRR